MAVTDEGFRRELSSLLNRHSLENGSNTPDFILSQYLTDCLSAWDRGIGRREEWYGRPVPKRAEPVTPSEPPQDKP